MRLAVISLLLLGACAAAPQPAPAELPGTGEDAGHTVLYRDTWGVAHIYAPTVEDGLYAQGYAQAQDRPEQLLANFKMALGEYSEVVGEPGIPVSLLSRMFDHAGNAEAALAKASPVARGRVQAFADGINAWYAAHPGDVPDWWRHEAVTAVMVDAFGRMFLNNWSIDEAIGDLQRGGVTPTFVQSARGSNQWAIAPTRSANGHAMLLIDPHLSWWGPSRFWEMRVHAGEWQGSGVGLAGSPYIGLGHNAAMAWAMTTGGPDTADVYVLTLNDAGTHYRYESAWRPLRKEPVTLRMPDGSERAVTLEYSHHGPILARRDGLAYAAKIPYDGDADRNAAWEALNFAADYRGAVAAGATLAMFPQNVMVADTSGNIHYQRVGRVPVRAAGYDWSKPVPGDTAATEWQGFHPGEDLVQMLNPSAGYMQNCNISPEGMIRGGAFDPDAFPPDVWTSAAYGAHHGWTNQRGARALELLSGDASVTVEEALAIANDIRPFGVERWVAALASSLGDDPDARRMSAWDGRLAADSAEALQYARWRMSLEAEAAGQALRARIDDHYAIVENRTPKVVELTDTERKLIRATWRQAMTQLAADFGEREVTWGDVFRVGRDGRSWPVEGGGGDQFGLTTLRAMGYDEPNADHQRMGNRGQTSTQVVVLSTPIESYIYLPVGQSDRKESPHYADQAEKVFSPRLLKPSWWTPEALKDHIESRTVLR